MIRNILKEDIKDIYGLVSSYDNNFHKVYDINKYLNNKDYILKVYTVNNKIVAFIIGINILGDYNLEYLFVDEKHRKKGIATKLINSIVDKENIKRIILEVSDSNKKALSLYKKFGFIIVNKRNKYYKDGSNALIMELIL